MSLTENPMYLSVELFMFNLFKVVQALAQLHSGQ